MSIMELATGKFAGFFPKDFREMSLRQRFRIVCRDFMYGTVGLFVLDISWRVMDVFIDFICDHIHWLHWLGDN